MNQLSGETTAGDYEYDNYYDYLASDFILDDLVEIVRGNVFAAGVAARLEEQGVQLTPSDVAGALAASREHRVLTILSTSRDHGLAVLIGNAAAIELRENFMAYLGSDDVDLPMTIRPVDVPLEAQPDTWRVRLTYILAVVVAAGFGLLVGIFLDYLDDSIPTATAAEAATGLPVIGTVRGAAK